MLIDAANGTTLWSDNYERPEGDVFDIQTEIAEAIANELKVPLGLEDTSDLVTPTADFEAYELYVAGRAEMRRRGEKLNEAVKLFEAAIARDSTFAPAWAALAEASEISVWYRNDTYDPEDDIPDSVEVARFLDQSEGAARRALVLDPDNASALVALASVHRDRARWAEAERVYRQALDIDPDNAEAHQQYAELLAHRGRIAEAVREIDRAAWLDPAPVRVLLLAYLLGYDDRWDEALAVLRYGLERDPDSKMYRWSAAQMFARSGDTEVAVRAMDSWLRDHLPQDSTWTRQSLESSSCQLPGIWVRVS
jgi:serine/threonine-protein kinase